jgi:hypothetical protein
MQDPKIIYMPNESQPTIAIANTLQAIAYIELNDEIDHDYYGKLFAAAPQTVAERDQLKVDVAQAVAALTDLLGDLPSIQGGVCQHCGRDYIQYSITGECPSEDCPSFLAREFIATHKPESDAV